MPVLRFQLQIHSVIVVAAIVVNAPYRAPSTRRNGTQRPRIEVVPVVIEIRPLGREIEVVLCGQLCTRGAHIPDAGDNGFSESALNVEAPPLQVRNDRAVLVDGLWLLPQLTHHGTYFGENSAKGDIVQNAL